MKYKVIVILILLPSIVLAACADSPERAAREWFDAMLNLDGNTILERTCLTQRAYIQEIGLWNSAIALLPQMFGLNMESQGDVSGLEFSTIDINSNETVASVRVSGEIRMAVLALAQSYPVDETWLMVKEDGGWRWCGIP
jgi:hypothetical protein